MKDRLEPAVRNIGIARPVPPAVEQPALQEEPRIEDAGSGRRHAAGERIGTGLAPAGILFQRLVHAVLRQCGRPAAIRTGEPSRAGARRERGDGAARPAAIVSIASGVCSSVPWVGFGSGLG